jgi:hypothetical protein
MCAGLTGGIWADARGFLDRATGLPMQAQLSLIFAVLFTTLFFLARYRLKLAQKPFLQDKQTVGISPDSFMIATSRGTHSFPWRSVRTATSDSHGIYITLDPGNRLIVPSHAFSSNEDHDAFLQTTQQLIHDSRNA